MALSDAEKQRRYRERLRQRKATKPVTVTDDIPFNAVTEAVTVTEPDGEIITITNAAVTVTEEQIARVTAAAAANLTTVIDRYAQQNRRWISEIADRNAVIEALLLENTQTLNKLRIDIQTLVTVTTPKTVVTDVTGRTAIPEPPPEPPVAKAPRALLDWVENRYSGQRLRDALLGLGGNDPAHSTEWWINRMTDLMRDSDRQDSPSRGMEGFRPVGSVLTTSLKNLPQPPLNNPHGRDPNKIK